MPEILTESFCERCGTRYTFESKAPRAGRGGLRTLTKGLKNYVLSDDTSLGDAMAAARGDLEREVTNQQLDAFHKTFNFCMSCRQYTCGNCWNEADNYCLTCAPHLGHEIMPAPFPKLEAADAAATDRPAVDALAWPSLDLPPAPSEPLAGAAVDGWPSIEVESAPAQPAAEHPTADRSTQPVAPAAGDAEPSPAPLHAGDASDASTDDLAAAASSRTQSLFGRFRPGQPADVEVSEPGAEADDLVEVEPAAEPVAAAPEPEPSAVQPEPEPVAGAPEPEPVAAAPAPEPVAAAPAPGPVAAEAEPTAAAAEPVPEPVAAVEPEPEPVAVQPDPEPVAAEAEPIAAATPEPSPARPAHDHVEQPTWRIVAPDDSAQPAVPSNGQRLPPPPAPAPTGEPQWPVASTDNLAFLRSPRSDDDVWAVSSKDLLAAAPSPPPGTRGPAVIQSCVSCGLSLSATARFCRRCGTRQA